MIQCPGEEGRALEFLYLDSKIAVCRKEPGVLSTDEPGGMPERIRAALGKEDAPVYTVHRLDAAVGGVMVYARTRHAASDLGKAIQAGRFCKEYLAVIHGVTPDTTGTFRDLLWRDTREGKTYVTDTPGKDAREAVLDYELLARREGLSLVQIILRTGRTHQIRCQFSARGLPLWGDRKYGAADGGEIALWSHALAFAHPATGEELSFTLPPPDREPWIAFKEFT